MKLLQHAALALIASFAMNAMAQSEGTAAIDQTASPSRAEVLADLHMWRQAGMHEFLYRESSDPVPTRHEAALARYEALRSSPAFVQLVQKLSARSRAFVART
jgi:hypothetical protein